VNKIVSLEKSFEGTVTIWNQTKRVIHKVKPMPMNLYTLESLEEESRGDSEPQ